MKKFFEDAELEIVKFNNADVITTSEDVNISDDVGKGDADEEF